MNCQSKGTCHCSL